MSTVLCCPLAEVKIIKESVRNIKCNLLALNSSCARHIYRRSLIGIIIVDTIIEAFFNTNICGASVVAYKLTNNIVASC